MGSFINKIKIFFRRRKVADKGADAEKVTLPGTYLKQEDVGKKVFEKTGRLREGVGQSSTVKRNNELAQSPQQKRNRDSIKRISRQKFDQMKEEES